MRRIGWACGSLAVVLLAAIVWAGTFGGVVPQIDGTGKLVPMRSGLPFIVEPDTGQNIELNTSGDVLLRDVDRFLVGSDLDGGTETSMGLVFDVGSGSYRLRSRKAGSAENILLQPEDGFALIGQVTGTDVDITFATADGDIHLNPGGGKTIQINGTTLAEWSRDTIGLTLTDTDTLDLLYDDDLDTISGSVRRQMSITADVNGLRLDGDTASPGNRRYYGTDSGGLRGFFTLPVASEVPFTPAGTITSTDVQAGIEELDSDVSSHTGATTDVHGIPDTATVPYPPVRVVATSNLTLSNPGTDTVDGVALSTGERLLLAGQTAGSENGIYTFDTSSTALTRAADMDASAELRQATIYVQEGTAWAKSTWQLTTTGSITLDTTALTFENVRLFQDGTGALTPLRPGVPLLIQPDADQNVEVNLSGSGVFEYNDAPVLTGPYTLQDAFDAGTAGSKGRITGCSLTEPCEYRGSTLKYQVYENAGAWFVEVRQISDDALIAIHRNIADGLTHQILGDSVPIVTYDGTTANTTQHRAVNYCEPAVGTDSYACNLTPAITGYVTGTRYRFKADVANTGAASLALNGQAATTIKKAAGGVTTDLADNDIRAGQMVEVVYDGTNFQLQSTLGNAGTGAALTVTEEDDSPSVSNVTEIRVPNGTLTDNTGGSVSISTGGSGGPVAPIRPYSAIPATAGKVFGWIIDGDEGLGVMASLDGDAIWRLRFQMPQTLASGCDYTLRVLAKADAATGTARVNPKWASVAVGESVPADGSLSAETVTPTSRAGNAGGTGDTLAWGTGDNNQFLELKWTLNADTVVGGEIVAMSLTFETASWTLAAPSIWLPSIVCE